MIIYDAETLHAVDTSRGADGWKDFKSMGISVICAYDYATKHARIFCWDNLHRFQELIDSTDIVAGFNSILFDNNLCKAHKLHIPQEKVYDIAGAIRIGHGQKPFYTDSPPPPGLSLDSLCRVNFGIGKPKFGGLAPLMWRDGSYGTVIDYCMQDVYLTKMLLDRIIEHGKIISPLHKCGAVRVKGPQI